MTKKEIISLLEKCAATAQAKTEAAKAEYQRVQDPAKKQSAFISTHANLAVCSTLQAILQVIAEDESGKQEEGGNSAANV